MSDDAKQKREHRERYDRLKADRGQWESHWEDVSNYIAPRKTGFTGERAPGEKQMTYILDNTGVHANELLAAALHGTATNPASQWFSLRMTDDRLNKIDAVKKYMAHAEATMRSRIYAPGTGFTTAIHENYLDLGAFGTTSLFIGQQANGGLLFQARTMAETVICENADGAVDTVYRANYYTVRQIVQKLRTDGWEPSERVKKLWDDGKFDERVLVIHGIYPRADRIYGKKDTANMDFVSCYFEHASCHVMKESGYPEMPLLTPRWLKAASELYGRCPGMTALPDVKMLQAMMATVIKSAQKVSDPPIFIPDDGTVGPVRMSPGSVNYYRGQRDIFPMPTSSGLPVTQEILEDLRNRIRNTFHADTLQMVDQREMTLGEARLRQVERMRLLGPVIGRLESEFLGPLVTRIFGILYRSKVLPELPEEMQGKEWTVEYVSPIANAQKQEEAAGIMQVMQYVSALGPETAARIISANVNGDRLLAYLWDLFNANPDLLLTPQEKVAMQRKADGMQSIEAAGPMADAALKGSGALKNMTDASNGGADIQQLLSMLQMRNQAA